MFQVRIHGRGGQGVVSASQMMSVAAFNQGLHAQAFPSFGSERMGAPVTAFVRIDEAPIELREPVLDPDLLIVQDATLFGALDLFSGLTQTGYVLVNSQQSLRDLGIEDAVRSLPAGHVVTIAATELAWQYLKRPTPNSVLLGAFAAMSDWLELAAVEQAIQEKFPGKVGDANVAAARAAFSSINGDG
ncbi:MAG: 2-oxoacid:acceptor oxidoreductase family protein [Pseudomonadota bacterium]|nr:2-oxoacid:acceptor oxidoreductase family protein [Pseudomonadota bacterium]